VTSRFTRCLPTLLLFASAFGTAQNQEIPPNIPGQMIDIGGYRLHINCTGKGSPAVILENGLGDNYADWALVQPKVAEFTRVCSYDRAYDGFSDAGPIPVTMHQEVYELHQLLHAARIRGPYILAGHSFGGILARLYASTYPADIAGLVFIDSTHEDVRMGDTMFRERAKGMPVPAPQTMKSSPPLPFTPEEQKLVDQVMKRRQEQAKQPVDPSMAHLPPDVLNLDRWARAHPKLPSTAKGLQEIWLAEEFQQMHNERANKQYLFGNIPIVVLGARRANPGDFSERQAQLEDMANFSHNSRLFVDQESSHHIQWDNPSLVIRSIRDVFVAAKKHSLLVGQPQTK